PSTVIVPGSISVKPASRVATTPRAHRIIARYEFPPFIVAGLADSTTVARSGPRPQCTVVEHGRQGHRRVTDLGRCLSKTHASRRPVRRAGPYTTSTMAVAAPYRISLRAGRPPRSRRNTTGITHTSVGSSSSAATSPAARVSHAAYRAASGARTDSVTAE